MKRLTGVTLCVLLLGFGVERALDTKLIAATPEAKPSDKPAERPATEPSAKPGTENKPSKELKTSGKTSGKKVDATGALTGAQKALAVMVKAARADKGLDPKTPKNKPYWTAVKKLSNDLDRAEKGLAAKNDDFFKAISDARSAEAQMKVDWQLTGSKNKKVIDSGKKLGHALAILRTNFSKEADRKKKGGDLTAKEKEQLAKIKKQQTALLEKLKPLQQKAKKDKGLDRGLKQITENANRALKAPETVDGLIATLYLLDELEGLLYGYDYYVNKSWRNDWVDVGTWTTGWDPYLDVWSPDPYVWIDTAPVVDIDPAEDFVILDEISDPEIDSQGDFAESAPVELSEPELDQVAIDQDNDPEVEADDTDDADSMEDPSDDDGADFDSDGDGGDDSDDDVHDDEEGDDDGGDDDGGDDDGE